MCMGLPVLAGLEVGLPADGHLVDAQGILRVRAAVDRVRERIHHLLDDLAAGKRLRCDKTRLISVRENDQVCLSFRLQIFWCQPQFFAELGRHIVATSLHNCLGRMS